MDALSSSIVNMCHCHFGVSFFRVLFFGCLFSYIDRSYVLLECDVIIFCLSFSLFSANGSCVLP